MIELEGGLGFLRIHDNGLVEIKNATTKGRFYLDDVIALKYTNPSFKANGSLEFKLKNKQAYTISFHEEYTDDFIFLKDWLIEKFGYHEYYDRKNTNAQSNHNSHKQSKKHSNAIKTILILFITLIAICIIVFFISKLTKTNDIYKPVDITEKHEIKKTLEDFQKAKSEADSIVEELNQKINDDYIYKEFKNDNEWVHIIYSNSTPVTFEVDFKINETFKGITIDNNSISSIHNGFRSLPMAAASLSVFDIDNTDMNNIIHLLSYLEENYYKGKNIEVLDHKALNIFSITLIDE